MNEIGKNKKMRTASEKETIVKRYLSGESPKKLAKEMFWQAELLALILFFQMNIFIIKI